MIIEPPAFQFVDLTLTPAESKPKRRTKSATRSVAPNSAGKVRVSLGVPQVQRLDEATLASDAALQKFVHAHPQHRFHLLHLACTLAADDSRRFEDAELRVRLDAAALGERPIAWSMDPRRVASTESIERTSSLGANLKFQETGAELGSKTTVKSEVEHPYIVAYGEQESTPFWRIQRISTREVDGSFRFSMVVKSAGPATVDVSLEAKVDTKLFGLIPYRTDPAAADPRLGVRLP